MKKSILTITAAALVLGFASCSKENEVNNGPVIDEGAPAYMSLSFTTQANTKTRSTNDVNSTEEESALYYVDVFVFNPSGVQVKHERFDVADFVGPTGTGSDEWKMKQGLKIATTTGTKTVIVGINLPSALSASLNGVMEGIFSKTAHDLLVSDATHATNGFIMFSASAQDITLVKEPTGTQNHLKAPVKRVVAKVAVQEGKSIDVTGDGYIDMGNLMFTLNNTNKKTYYVQPVDLKDHNWATTPVGDLYTNNTDFINVNGNGVAVKSLLSKYCLENTTQNFLMGQITRVTVRGTFVPKQVKKFANGLDNTAGYVDFDVNSSETPKDFYLLVSGNGTIRAYFFDLPVAFAFATDNNIQSTPLLYTGGMCYWDIFLNPDNHYDVYRNDFYRCTITKIIGPGRNTPEVTDPTKPPAQPADMIVDIEILHWNLIDKDVILEP